MKKAVCLVSGGLDSTVTTYIAKKNNYDLFPLSFLYGQQHEKELQSARTIGSLLTEEEHIFFTLPLHQFGGSILYKSEKPQIKSTPLDKIGTLIPPTYVPARNTVFLSIALSYAESLDAGAIYIGVTATDYSGYPDCRPEYIEAFQTMADLATKKGVEQKQIKIETPLLYLTKKQIIIKGVELNVPFELTWSCYQGRTKACGLCDSCQLRLKGFQEAGIRDPIEYETTPDFYKIK
ncbi:MAG: 7-cyano-7-deazaguanine synthase QueC [Candidatus Thermoplasmatota archaeon]|nr:7-cyano-7-deazaguanine synthase QueC [Candidatus Thermoplasmatota archaeon]